VVALRRRERHVARLGELAAEFGRKAPIDDRGAILPTKGTRQPAPLVVDSNNRFNDPAPPKTQLAR
jgi:hypothetical protein